MLSIVIPTYNSAATLKATLDALQGVTYVTEIIVSDGGSQDQTLEIAEKFGARVIAKAQGRGPQLAAGGQVASNDWILFLHSDTVLEEGWSVAVQRFMTDCSDKAAILPLHWMMTVQLRNA